MPSHTLRVNVGFDFAFNVAGLLEPSFGKVVHLLQVQPKFGAIAEEAGEAESGVWRDGALAEHDVANAGGGDADLHGQFMLAETEGSQEFFP